MTGKNSFNPVFFLFILVFVLCAVSVIACTPQPVATPLPPLPSSSSTASVSASSASAKSSVASTSSASASSKAASSVAASAKVVRTVDDVTKSIATSQFMDGKHQAKGITCDACHTAMPPKGAPEMSVCLKCHFGSMTALAEKTNKVDPNPHKFHEDVSSCADCHTGHGPFVYGCGKAGCHTEYSNTRFK